MVWDKPLPVELGELVGFDEEGDFLYASGNNTSYLLETSTGEIVRTISKGVGVSFTPEYMITYWPGSGLRLWDINERRVAKILPVKSRPLAFSANGKHVVVREKSG